MAATVARLCIATSRRVHLQAPVRLLSTVAQPAAPVKREHGELPSKTSRLGSTLTDDTLAAVIDDLYRASSQAFTNFPAADVHFKVGEHFMHKGEAHPQLYFRDSEEPGLLHLTPPAPATYCWFGERGNLGKKKMFLPNHPEVTDPWEAEQEVSVKISTPLTEEYLAWLQEIQDKYVEHLVQHAGAYKKLKKLEGKNPVIIRDMASPLVKFSKDENENRVPGTDYLSWRQRIYNKSERQAKIRCELDEQMAVEHGVRRHIPLYTLNGQEVPLDQVRLWHNDIISVQNNIMCGLWGIGNMVGYKLRRNLRSVTLVEPAVRDQGSASPPMTEAPFGH